MTLVLSSPLCLLIILGGNQRLPPFPWGRERTLAWLLPRQGSTAECLPTAQNNQRELCLAWRELEL